MVYNFLNILMRKHIEHLQNEEVNVVIFCSMYLDPREGGNTSFDDSGATVVLASPLFLSIVV
jgi:hypothetical protein